MFKSKTQIRTVRFISIAAISVGLIFVGSSVSARLTVGNFVNKALTVVRGPAKPKPAPRKRTTNVTSSLSQLGKTPLSPLSFSLIPQANEASVSTDKLHYQPGETVLITGAGFRANERVTLQVRHHDQRVEVGSAYDPWDVQADGEGKISASWMVDPNETHGNWLKVKAKGAESGRIAMVFFTDPAMADLDQCANGPASAPVPCTLDAWQNGNVNQNQAHYTEGDSVPYRMKFAQLIIGASNTVTISYDTTKNGKHALDYLTDYDRTETTGNNPCSGVADCLLASETTFPIPLDPKVENGQNQVPGGGDDITQIAGSFSMFGGTITAVSAYTVDGTYANDSTTSITITFTADVTNPVMAWGGHIGTRVDWGAANSAINISGSPYHMRLEDLNGSGGNQDRSLSASAVFFPVSVTIVKETNPDNAQAKTFNYTTTGTGLSPFSLTPPNGLTPDSKNFLLSDETARTVTESDPSAAAPQFTLTALTCIQTDGGLGVGTFNTNLGTRTVSFTPKEGQSLTCTFVNEQVLGKIIVDKVTVPADSTSFNFTTTYGGPFSLTDASTPNDSGFIVPGTYQVTEAANADYSTTATCTSSLGDPADDPSSIDLDGGETVTCTFTNTKKPKLTVTKILVPSNDTGLFNLQIDGVTQAANVGDGGSTGAQFVTVGAHTAGETAGTGTSLTDYTTVIGGDCDAAGNVTLAAGDNKTCTITNTRKPKLTVTKILVPSNDTGLFNLQIDGVTQAANVGDGGSTGAQFVTVGAHTVGETAGTGTSLTDYTTVIGGDCDAAGNVTLAAGDNKTCTITNTRRPKLTVTKILVPPNDTGLFNLQIDGVTQAANVGNGGATGAQFVTIGAHTVGETAGAGTSLTDYTTVIGGDCDAAGNVTLAAGDDKTCTITNTRRPKLTVTKILVPSNDTGLFNLQIDAVTQAANVGNGGTTGAQFVSIGAHTVAETAGTGTVLSDYTTVIGGDCDAAGNVTLAAGDNKTCTITNTRRPRLTVTKILLPANDTGLFNLQIDAVTLAANVGDGGTTGPQFVSIGGHIVSETAGTGTSLSDYVTVIGGHCAANGSVTLAAGDNKTCTITNTKKGMAQVVKTVSGLPPAAGQSFTFELRQGASTSSDGTVIESKNTDASGNINFTTKLIPGDTYQICEWVFPGWNTNLAGDGPLFVPSSIIPPALPNPNVNNLTVCADFTVQPGETRTFTVNNTPPPGGRALTIGFWKNWASCSNSNGKGQKPMLDLALGFASATTTNPPGGLVLSAQNPGSLWPNYAAAWYLVLKGDPTSTANNIKPAPDCTKAVNLLSKSTIDGKKKQASDPLFNMTAQLLAAELNRFMGAGISGITIMNIDRAVLLNGKYKFNGLTYSPKLTKADTNTANCLAAQLDNYNNGRPVSLCP